MIYYKKLPINLNRLFTKKKEEIRGNIKKNKYMLAETAISCMCIIII